ncbi:MAG: hypothetical protein ACYCYE_11455 [Clostridia bacterium]
MARSRYQFIDTPAMLIDYDIMMENLNNGCKRGACILLSMYQPWYVNA